MTVSLRSADRSCAGLELRRREAGTTTEHLHMYMYMHMCMYMSLMCESEAASPFRETI